MSTTPFGERLRRERELRGVSLDEISAATRIKLKYLEALENQNWGDLPGGIFNRGFIRTVARYLGMDEDTTLAEYALAQEDMAAAAERFVKLTKQPRPWGQRLSRGAFVVVGLAVIAALGWLGYRGTKLAWRAAASHQSVQAQPVTPPSSTPTPTQAGTPAVPIASPQLEQSASENNEAEEIPAVATKPYIELQVEAGKRARIRVFADHHRLYTGDISAGETRRYRARNTFEIFSSDSGAVLIELEGETMPPLGPSGQPGRATFTRRDLATAAGGTH
jgi:cytoskeletal protein RodZ